MNKLSPPVFALFALFALVFAGCAATAGRTTAITDVRTVTGEWTGQIVGRSGTAFPAQLTINPAGSYEADFWGGPAPWAASPSSTAS